MLNQFLLSHFLLPTDGSELSMRAVDTGIGLGVRLEARVCMWKLTDQTDRPSAHATRHRIGGTASC